MKHVHRHFKHLENLLYMYNITFCKDVAVGGAIEILDLTLHPVTADGIIDHNVIPENVEITSAVKLNVLKMLIADGVIVLE